MTSVAINVGTERMCDGCDLLVEEHEGAGGGGAVQQLDLVHLQYTAIVNISAPSVGSKNNTSAVSCAGYATSVTTSAEQPLNKLSLSNKITHLSRCQGVISGRAQLLAAVKPRGRVVALAAFDLVAVPARRVREFL
jgi:hypothetical protein